MDKPKRQPQTDLSQVRPSYLYDDEKPKRKRRPQSWLHRWLFGRQFSFYSPYTLEECAELLGGLGDSGWQNPIHVTLILEDDNHYSFKLKRDASRNLIGEALGTLTRTGESTFVEGRGRIGTFTLLFLGIWTPFWSLLMLMIFPVFSLLGIILSALFLASAAEQREFLTRLVVDELGKLR